MNQNYNLQETILSKLDDLMEIAEAIEKSSRPLTQTEVLK